MSSLSQISIEELRRRLREGLSSEAMCVIFSSNYTSLDEVRNVLRESGLYNAFGIRILRSENIPGNNYLIIVYFKEEVCDKKCLAECGSKESICFGKCIYKCIEDYRKIASEKLG